jgi:hypothetical protein
MITRHHFSLTLLCTLILCCGFFQGDPIISGLVITGAIAGAILPDIQMKKPSRFRAVTLAYFVTRFTNRLCVSVMVATYRFFLPNPPCSSDKRLTHSLTGIAWIGICVAALLLVPAAIMGDTVINRYAAVFVGGVLLGLLLHLVLDLCTRKGISPFFPFSTYHLKGSIRPCDTGDRRILYFHLTCLMVLAGMIALVIHEPAGSCLIRPAGLLGFVFCTGTMIVFSRSGGTGDARYALHGMVEGAGPLTPPYPR